MVTSSTTELKTLNWWMRSLTSDCTAAASSEPMDGTSHAESAELSTTKVIITSEQTEFRLGAESAALQMPLTISVVEKRSGHPTCKPVSLMRWLVRLITPQGGTVLDPFAGTFTTGQAALAEGFNPIGIEADPAHFKDCLSRIRHVVGGTAESLDEDDSRTDATPSTNQTSLL